MNRRRFEKGTLPRGAFFCFLDSSTVPLHGSNAITIQLREEFELSDHVDSEQASGSWVLSSLLTPTGVVQRVSQL